jgi:O-antigen/teichoic acid export membrane protein
MSFASRIKRAGLLGGTVIVFIGLGVDSGFSLLTNIILGRTFESDGYGVITTGLTTFSLLVTFLTLGLGTANSRFVPREAGARGRRSVFFSSVLVVLPIVIVAGLAGVALLLADVSLFGYEPESLNVIGIFVVAVPFAAFTRLAVAYMRGLEMAVMKTLVQNLVQPSLTLLVVVTSVAFGVAISTLAWGYVLVFGTQAVIVTILLWQKTDLKLSLDFDDRKRTLLSFSLPLVATTGVKSIFTHSDVYLIGLLQSVQQVGVYKSGYVLAKFLGFTLMAVNFLFLPRISSHLEDDNSETVQRLYLHSSTWLVLFTFPLFLTVLVFPGEILTITFGEEYLPAALPLLVLGFAFFVHSSIGLNGTMLMSTGNVRILFVTTLIASVANVCLNLVLIPRIGILGAAFATLAAYLLMNVFQFAFIWRMFGVSIVSRKYVSLALAAVSLTAIYLSLTGLLSLSFLLRVFIYVIFLITFLGIGYAVGALDVEQILDELRRAVPEE